MHSHIRTLTHSNSLLHAFFVPSLLSVVFFTYKLTHSPILPGSAEDTACDASTSKCIGLEQTHSPCSLGDHIISVLHF